MRCKDAHKLMDAWIDGELSPEKRVTFEHHLVSCRTCSAEAEDLRSLTGFLDTHPSAQPSPELEKKTMALFLGEAGPRGLLYWWADLGWGMQAAMAASALIGLGIGCNLGDGWIGMQQLSQYSISGFLFSAGDLLLSWA